MGREMLVKSSFTAVPSNEVAAMKIGAVAGGAISAVQNTYGVAHCQITYKEVVVNVTKETDGFR